MDYQEITREDCAEAMARILMVLSRIVLEPQDNSSDYEKAQIAFNAFAEGVDYPGAVFQNVVFDEEFEKKICKAFLRSRRYNYWVDPFFLERRFNRRCRRKNSGGF